MRIMFPVIFTRLISVGRKSNKTNKLNRDRSCPRWESTHQHLNTNSPLFYRYYYYYYYHYFSYSYQTTTTPTTTTTTTTTNTTTTHAGRNGGAPPWFSACCCSSKWQYLTSRAMLTWIGSGSLKWSPCR